jgi:hypothetical protein
MEKEQKVVAILDYDGTWKYVLESEVNEMVKSKQLKRRPDLDSEYNDKLKTYERL